jgi:hypothetical protein
MGVVSGYKINKYQNRVAGGFWKRGMGKKKEILYI